jgi:hypothetical protein
MASDMSLVLIDRARRRDKRTRREDGGGGSRTKVYSSLLGSSRAFTHSGE